MALGKSRKIVVDGVTYQWRAKFADKRLKHWSPATVNLVVMSPQGSVLKTQLRSLLWTDEHEHNTDVAPEHVASFYPYDVVTCIREAVALGWAPAQRGRGPFVLDPPPLCRDYGPKDAHRSPCRWRERVQEADDQA